MDTVSTQPVHEIPIQPSIVPNPIQSPPKQKGSLRKLFDMSSWIFLFAFLPLTVLIFLSQDSIPGDLFYPVKRSLENVILAAASVSPATRAAFRTDLTATRFKEAQTLVISKSNVSGLSTFIDEIQGTQLEVVSLKNDTEREKAEEKLINKLEEYQAGLSTLEAKTEENIIAYQFQEMPTPTFTPTPTLVPTSTPILRTTTMPTSTPVKQASSASPEASAPTLTLAPTIEPTAAPQPENAQVTKQKKISETIKETKEQLHKIKKDLEEKRKENKENREERNESEKRDKEDGENKDNSGRNK